MTKLSQRQVAYPTSRDQLSQMTCKDSVPYFGVDITEYESRPEIYADFSVLGFTLTISTAKLGNAM